MFLQRLCGRLGLRSTLGNSHRLLTAVAPNSFDTRQKLAHKMRLAVKRTPHVVRNDTGLHRKVTQQSCGLQLFLTSHESFGQAVQ